MKIQLTLDGPKSALLERLMEGSYMTRAGFLVHLMAEEERRRGEEKAKRSPGRPSKSQADANNNGGGDNDELPDENAPRTQKIPEHLKQYVPRYEREKLVNEYDIVMLEAKAELPKG